MNPCMNQYNERTNERMNACMNACMNECMNECMNCRPSRVAGGGGGGVPRERAPREPAATAAGGVHVGTAAQRLPRPGGLLRAAPGAPHERERQGRALLLGAWNNGQRRRRRRWRR